MSSYIDGTFFKSLCDVYLDKNILDYKNPQKEVILYADTHDYKKALSLINYQSDRNFTLVTHNSDDRIDKTDMPPNLDMWYGLNINFEHPKLQPIPIGLENEHWHPNKRRLMQLANSTVNPQKRKIKALCQFNQCTFKEERTSILFDVINEKIFADQYYCLNGENFREYAYNLNTYAFCLCPRGNGIDTHRLWECLYSGCIPIIKDHITHKFDLDLPVVIVDDWKQVTQNFLEQIYLEFPFCLFNSDLLKQEYWKEKITYEKDKN